MLYIFAARFFKNTGLLFNNSWIRNKKMTDPIADYLTRLRNAIKANHRVVEIPASNLKKEITKVLFDKGYILNYKFEDTTNHQGKALDRSFAYAHRIGNIGFGPVLFQPFFVWFQVGEM